MKLSQRREAIQFFKKRFAKHLADGKTSAQALEAAKVDGEKEYGADWSKILELLKTLLPILLALFKK